MSSSDLMHSSDGIHHACCICFEWFTIDQLEPADEPGKVWDVCKGCAETERIVKRDRWCHVSTPHGEHGVCRGWPR